MIRRLVLLLAIAGAAWFVMTPEESAYPRKGAPGPFPSEWFMHQRMWPHATLDHDRVMAGARSAAAMRNRALDEDPFWVQHGPTNIGGRITDIVGHPTDDNIYYVASASGGVFKTTDAGQTFVSISDALPTPSCGALAIDPGNPNRIYLGSGEANSAGYSYPGSGLYVSADAGSSWQLSGLANTRYIARVVVHPENPQHVWVAAMGELFAPGGDRGIYFSDDAGATWSQVLTVNDSTGASDVVVHPENPDIVYAAMWQRVRGPEERRAGGRGSGIYKSTNRGATWTRLSAGLPPAGDDVGRIGLAISSSNPSVLYACYADHPGFFLGVYRSDDAGESWVRANDESLTDAYSNFGWYFGNIRVRPDDEDMVFVLGVTAHRSTNGGASWEEIAGNVHVDHHALWFDPQQPFRFLLGNDGGLYRTLDNGNDFVDLNNFPAIQFYAATYDAQQPQRLYGGTQDNGTLRSLTGDPHEFDRIYGGDGFYTLVDPNNNSYVYAEYQYGGLGRSTNGGDEFQWALNGIDDEERRNWSTPVVFDPNNTTTLYYGAERVYRTTNRAVGWTAISPDLTDGGGSGNLVFGTITTIAVSPANSQVIYAGTDDANLWVTSNGGTTWQRRDAGLPQRWITRVTPHPTNVNEALVTVSGYRELDQQAHLYRTSDRGLTWSEVGSTLPDVPLNDVLYDSRSDNIMYVASDFGMFWSADAGATWAALGRGLPPVPTLDIVLDPVQHRLIAATYGRSFLTLPLDSLDANHRPQIVSVTPSAPNDTVRTMEGMTVQFAVIASDLDEDALSYSWSVDGEQFATTTEAAYHFAVVGDFQVSIEVSDGLLSVRDSMIVHVDSSLAASSAELPQDFTLQAFPNPFNSQVQLEYALPAPGDLRIEVFSVDGRLAAEVLVRRMSAGTHTLNWSPSNLASGTYIARMQTAATTRHLKLLYLK